MGVSLDRFLKRESSTRSIVFFDATSSKDDISTEKEPDNIAPGSGGLSDTDVDALKDALKSVNVPNAVNDILSYPLNNPALEK